MFFVKLLVIVIICHIIMKISRLLAIAEEFAKSVNDVDQNKVNLTEEDPFIKNSFAKIKYIVTFSKDLYRFAKDCENNRNYIDTSGAAQMGKRLFDQIDIVTLQLDELKISLHKRFKINS